MMAQINSFLKKTLQGITLSLALTFSPFYDSPVQAQPTSQPVKSLPTSEEQNNTTDILKLALGKSSRIDTVLEPFMIVSNAASLRRVLHNSLFVIQPEQEGISGSILRLGHFGLDYYLEYLFSVSAHELGHYGELVANAVRNPNIDLNGLWLLNYGGASYRDAQTPVQLSTSPNGLRILEQDSNFVGTSQEKMAIAGRGEAIELLLAREMLKEVAKRDRNIQALEASSYFWNHSKILKGISLLTSGRYGSTDMYSAEGDTDTVAYNRYSLIHKLFPYSLSDSQWKNYPHNKSIDEFIANLPADIQRPSSSEGEVMLYNYFLLKDNLENKRKFKDPHQIGVRLFSFLDPYSLTSMYAVSKYLLTADKNQRLPPAWMPQFNGYLGVPGPQYGLAWFIPSAKGLLNPELRLGFSPEFASAVGMGLDDLKIPRTRLSCNLGVEFIYQRDGTPIDDSTIGGTLTTELKIPITNKLGIGVYHLYQSDGIWSPYRFGLRENHTIGITLNLLSF